MISVSPSGTQSKLLYPRVIDSITGFKNFTNWTVTSLHYWGENPVGEWNIIIENTKKDRKVRQGKMWYNTCKKTFYLGGLIFGHFLSHFEPISETIYTLHFTEK